MRLNLELIESLPAAPKSIMDKDSLLLSTLSPEGPLLLHLYEWSAPSLTYGHFSDPSKHLNLDAVHQLQLQMARRPTGGGIIFHLTDFAFSILIPANHPRFSLNTLENYSFINGWVSKVVSEFSLGHQNPSLYKQESSSLNTKHYPFCMAKPTLYDLLINGKKVGGAAQRRTKQGLLHQGSLSLAPTPEYILKKVLKEKEGVMQSISNEAGYLLGHASEDEIKQARLTIRNLIKKMALKLV